MTSIVYLLVFVCAPLLFAASASYVVYKLPLLLASPQLISVISLNLVPALYSGFHFAEFRSPWVYWVCVD